MRKKTLKSRQAGDPTRSSGNPYTASARDTHMTQLCPLVHYSSITCEVSQIVKTLQVKYVLYK
jgi:hypothetical protein